MTSENPTRRFVYHTRGVCPTEIHFNLNGDRLENARFVGGGCPGNAELVSRLIQGKPFGEIMDDLAGIDCRNGTSCPDQLGKAIRAALSGQLQPSESYRILQDMAATDTVGIIAGINGHAGKLSPLIDRIRAEGIDTIFCVGNLTGDSPHNSDVIRILKKEKIPSVQGELDMRYAGGTEKNRPPMGTKDRDRLVRLPQVLAFQVGEKKGVAFYGRFVQELPGYSDFDTYALEMNMVCGMTDFMRDESVFPALEAMVPQFLADIVVFAQTDRAGHWHVGGKDFVGIGPSTGSNGLSCAVLSNPAGRIEVKTIRG
jgi:uncharacterized protein (TIGR03905 family)